MAPFVNPGLEWDFRLEKVVSINVSGHKYGLVYPGVGWVIWRDPEFLPKELVFNINYLGADQASFTLNFSRGASQIIGQYYQMIRLGKRGYRRIMLNLTRTADYLSANLEEMGFIILSQKSGEGLPLVACRLDEDLGKQYDEFAIAHQLRERGWVVPAYTMAPHSDKMKLMRVVVREDFTKSRCDALIADFKLALETLDAMDIKRIQHEKEYVSAECPYTTADYVKQTCCSIPHAPPIYPNRQYRTPNQEAGYPALPGRSQLAGPARKVARRMLSRIQGTVLGGAPRFSLRRHGQVYENCPVAPDHENDMLSIHAL